MYVARQQRVDVVLVDTAGRMQDNEPLMRALAKVHHCTRAGVMCCDFLVIERGLNDSVCGLL